MPNIRIYVKTATLNVFTFWKKKQFFLFSIN